VTHVRIHSSSVRAIKDYGFRRRRELVLVIIKKELEEIGEEAFASCISLQRIVIPNAIKTVKH
jgi:hypothetical protein